jgi:hypothetical protein
MPNQDLSSSISSALGPQVKNINDLPGLLRSAQADQAAGAAAAKPTLEETMKEIDAGKADLVERRKRLDASEASLDKVETWKPQPPKSDPINAFGSWGAAFVMLAAGLSKRHTVNALNAGAELIKAQKAGDQARYEEAYKAWQDNNKLALEKHKVMMDDYVSAQDTLKNDVSLGLQKAQLVAKQHDDQAAEKFLALGQYDKFFELQDARTRLGLEGEKIRAELEDRKTFNDLSKKAVTALGPDATPEQKAMTIGGIRAKLDGKVAEGMTLPKIAAQIVMNKYNEKLIALGPKATDADKSKALSDSYTEVVNMKTMAAGNDISDASYRRMALEYLGGNTSIATGFGYGIAGQMRRDKFQNTVTELMQEKGMTPEQVNAKVAEFKGLIKEQDAVGARAGQIDLIADEFQNMAPLGLEASDKVSRTQFPTLNKVIESAQAGTGDTNIIQFVDATQSLANIYARIMTPTGQTTDAARNIAMKLLSEDYSKGQYKAGVEQLKREIDIVQKAPEDVRERLRLEMYSQKTNQSEEIRTITSSEERNTLPVGAKYRAPDGKIHIKGPDSP